MKTTPSYKDAYRRFRDLSEIHNTDLWLAYLAYHRSATLEIARYKRHAKSAMAMYRGELERNKRAAAEIARLKKALKEPPNENL